MSPPQAYLLRACQVPHSKLHQKLLQATQVIISLVREREGLAVELQEWRKGRGRSEHRERSSLNCSRESQEKCQGSQLAAVGGPPQAMAEKAGSQDNHTRAADTEVHERVSEPSRAPKQQLELSLQSLQFSDSSELESVHRVLQLVDNSGLTSGLEPLPHASPPEPPPRASTPQLKEPDYLQTPKGDHPKLPAALQSEQPLYLQGNRMSSKPRPLQSRPASSQRRRAQLPRKTGVRNYNIKDS